MRVFFRTALFAAFFATVAPLAAQSFGSGARAIRSGDTLTGTLTASDPTLDDGSHYDLYLYDGTPGETVVLTLRSEDFDAFLIGGAIGDDGLDDILTDDDGAGGTDSQLTFEIGSTGRAAFQANSLGAGSTGRYTIFAESIGGGGGRDDVVRAGQTVRGQLDSRDVLLDDGSYYDLYTVAGSPGEQVAITMRSSDFDAFLSGGPLVGGAVSEVTDFDDDSAGGTDAQMVVTIGPDGTYGARANSLSAGDTGDYTLAVEALSGPAPGPSAGATTIRAGDSVQGSLASGDETLPDDSVYDLYEYQGEPGESIEVFMASSDFDTYLLGGATERDAFAGTSTDDDGGGGTNAQLRVTTGSDGRYTIIANAYSPDARGSYQLTVRSAGGGQPSELPGVTAIRINQTVTGQLASSDATLDDGSYYDLYTYEGEAGEDIVVTLTSSDFDTYVMLNRVFGGELESVASDDDGGPGTNARIRATLDQTGTYVIVANSYAANLTGTYTLVVERPGAVADAEAEQTGYPSLSIGSPASGRLESGDTVLADDSYADLYLFRGTPGETVAVTMRSSDFDAYLTVGTIEGSDVAVVGRDNNGGGGNDARVRFTVGASGAYAVQANSFAGGETGAYTLAAERTETTAQAPGRPQSQTPSSAPSQFTGKWAPLTYETTTNYEPVRDLVSGRRHLERVSERLSTEYPLPRNVSISFSECTEPGADFPYINAYYQPSEAAITFCYELVADIVSRLGPSYPEDQLANVVDGAYDFVMLHEVGHALTHQLDLPITGREEDVADQFATLALLRQGERGALAALYGVDYLYRLGGGSEGASGGGRPLLADEHSLGPQRLYNVQCWILGSDIDKYAWLVLDEEGNERTDEYGLPVDRARRCPGEYAQMEKSFERLLELVYNE